MRRRAKPAKAEVEAKPPAARESRKSEGSTVQDLEKRLTEALKREAVALERETAALKRASEALEQQTATAEILHVISSSPTDVQPVFEVVLASGVGLCGASFGGLFRFDGELIHLVTSHEWPAEQLDALSRRFPMPPGDGSLAARAIRDRQVVQTPDYVAESRAGVLPGWVPQGEQRPRSTIAIPMLREGRPLGAIVLARAEPGLFSDKHVALLQTFADQAVIAIENVRLFNETKEALDQQTATAEILRVISSSPTDIQPVLDAVVENAARLCESVDCNLFLLHGDRLVLAARHGPPGGETVGAFSLPIVRGTVGGRTVLERSAVHVVDLLAEADEYPQAQDNARRYGFRTMLSVPLIRNGAATGVIQVRRTDVRRFTDRQVALLNTFTEQAVIAIENVRLFNETKEALEQQTATSEILRVISRSPTELQPVLAAVTESASRVCGADDAMIRLVDGDALRLVTHYGPLPDLDEIIPRNRGSATGRAIADRRAIHIHDLAAESEGEFPVGRSLQRRFHHRTVLAVPLLREGVAIGGILIRRQEVRPFADKQIALLQTFADQAVIAIENVRLFTELQSSNRNLTRALDQQTATGEILGVISSSPTDVQPVFDAIVRSASRLCGGEFVIVTRYDGDLLHLAAQYNARPGSANLTERLFPRRLGRDLPSARAILDGAHVHIPDAADDRDLSPDVVRIARSFLSVPMIREDVPIGAIGVSRATAEPFAPEQIALLQTFADQAVIAIENVRLFTELQEKNQALTQAHAQVTDALEQQTATSEILSVISRSQADVQPVFDTIIRNAVTLCGGLFGSLYRYDGEMLHPAAQHNYTPEALEALHRAFPARPTRGLMTGRAILDRAVVHIPDVELDPEHRTPTIPRAVGWRSALLVPMLRDGRPIGVIGVSRAEPGRFSDNQIELLKTFADQAVIAIENARLLSELQDRTQQLTHSVEQLTALGDVGRAVSSSLDLDTVLSTIVGRAVQLSRTHGGTIFEYDEIAEEFSARATLNADEGQSALLRAIRLRRGEGAVGQMAVTREPFQIPDIAAEGTYESRIRAAMLASGTRSVLAIPLLHEERLVGGLVVTRRTPGAFSAEVVELLRTFATQSALAIQNARLFREIEEKSRQLEVASQHKSEFLANMSHELRTPLNAIIGFSEVLSERMFGELNEKQDEYLKDIYASGTHLLSLINDILDLSKIEAGRMELELSDFHLPQAIDNALTLVRERAGRRGIGLAYTMDERLGQIRGDERKVKQVLLNLLSNALKFTPEAGRVDVRAGIVDGMAEISVTDTGVGIAPEDQGAIFEEFRQVGTADKKAEGTGLGLTLCRKFVELHGGRIWVKSQVGAGSTFTFTIPVRRGE